MALLACALVMAAAGGLWWANHTGLPESWRAKAEQALAGHGVVAEIASLKYLPLKGIEASDVTVYTDATKLHRVAHVDTLLIKVDRTKLARGEVRPESLELSGGGLSLAVDPGDPESKALEIRDACGQALMPGGGRLEVKNATGSVSGIRIQFDAMLLGYKNRMLQQEDKEKEEQARLYRRKLLSQVIALLEPWHFDPGDPPKIRVRVEGDIRDPRSIRADLALESNRLERDGIRLAKLTAKGEMRGRMLVLESFEAGDGVGALKGKMEYDLAGRAGRFEGRSDLDLPHLLQEVDSSGWLKRFSFQAPPQVAVRGTFDLTQAGAPQVRVTGHLTADHFRFGAYAADHAGTDFSWDGARVFLQNIEIKRPDGGLRGRFLLEPELVRYELQTDLGAAVWQGLFKGQVLGAVLADFGDLPGAAVETKLHGSFDREHPELWTAIGEARGKNISFRGVPVHEASVKLSLNHDFLDFVDGKVNFNYTDYPLRKAHGGPVSGKGTVGRVRWDREASSVIVDEVKGDFWPAPVVRTFAAGVADQLEKYGLHRPAALAASGVIGIGPAAKKTDLRITAATDSGMDYDFAGARLDLDQLKVKVKVGPGVTEVRDLSFEAFGGPVRGRLDIHTGEPGGHISGELDWTQLSLPLLSETYGFESKPKGEVTGRLEFDHHGSTVAGLNGEGLVALEKGELFSVPIFGPLSGVLSAVLANKKAGFEEARDAFCTFRVKDGVLSTDDFLTGTPSLVFTGEATVDLNEMMLDMTMRMNARGLFGVITLPLRPFYGLFQFHGQGPLRKPKWDSEMFTSPPKKQEERLMEAPKARALGGGDRAEPAERLAPGQAVEPGQEKKAPPVRPRGVRTGRP